MFPSYFYENINVLYFNDMYLYNADINVFVQIPLLSVDCPDIFGGQGVNSGIMSCCFLNSFLIKNILLHQHHSIIERFIFAVI